MGFWGYALIAVAVIGYAGWSLVLASNEQLRGAANEFSARFRTLLPYALTIVGYFLLRDGALVAALRGTFGDAPSSSGYAAVAALLVVFFVWFAFMLTHDRIRGVTNEVWGVYFMNAFKLLWPYVLIYALYAVVRDGTLGATLRAAFH